MATDRPLPVQVAAGRAPGRPRARRRAAPAVRLVRYAVSVLLTLALWQTLSTYVINPHLLPPPARVARAVVPMLSTGELEAHVTASLSRIAVGFSLGSLTGVAFGLLAGRIAMVADLTDPQLQFFRFLSPTAMIPLAIIWFGIGELSKYFLILYATFFIVVINTVAGVAATPPVRVRAAQAMGARPVQIFLFVVLPSAVPHVLSGMRVALASAFMAIIPAEMLAAESGLGFLLQQAGLLVQTDRIFVALAMISLLGFASDLAFRLLIGRLLFRYTQAG
ncbi:MAG: ABC transporter permease [Armatimonadota bacterium]|nr:ABC transporter permease [Armatimonadota bacterium]MDR7534683.1 ABC transporter permease [Armatimonadota bacterium]MDR7536374.1 ABC transporter permease [Armatimonadota bacterium]